MAHQNVSPFVYTIAILAAGAALLGFAACRGFFTSDSYGMGRAIAVGIGTLFFAAGFFKLNEWPSPDGRPWYARPRAFFIVPLLPIIPSYVLGVAFGPGQSYLDIPHHLDFQTVASAAAGMMCIWIVLLSSPSETPHMPYVPPVAHADDDPFEWDRDLWPTEHAKPPRRHRPDAPPGRYIPRRTASSPQARSTRKNRRRDDRNSASS